MIRALARQIGLPALLLLPLLLPAQRYSFKQYSQNEGLSNLDIEGLMQDREGYLWVATDGGLFRYDGHRFRRYSTADGLPALQVAAVHQTADGAIWAATLEGLARLRGEVFEKAYPEARGVSSLASDANDTLYVGTDQGLLAAPAAKGGGPRKFQRYTAEGAEKVLGIAVDRTGTVWFVCGVQLCTFQNGKVTRRDDLEVPRGRWDGLLFDRRGDLWMRSVRSMAVLPHGGSVALRRDEGLPFATRRAMVVMDRAGEVYVPTWQGLAHYTGHGWELIRRANGLPMSAVDAFLEDREGSAWIALDGGGLVRWLGYKRWENFTESEGLNHDVVWAIARDTHGTLWAGTQAGLSGYLAQAHRWDTVPHPILDTRPTLTLTADRDGTIWIGQAPGGLVHLNPLTGRTEHYGSKDGLDCDWIYSVAMDAADNLWVSGAQGVYRGRRSASRMRFEWINLPGERPNRLGTVMADGLGRIWATSSSGLSYLADGRWHLLTTREGLQRNAVAYLAEAPDHSVWLAYRDLKTLSRVEVSGNKVSIRHMDRPGGKAPAKPYFMRFDRRGWLWLGTDAGVNRFDGSYWTHYDQPDGMPIGDCDHNAFFEDNDGSIWLGTSRGLAHFLVPAAADPRPHDAQVVLTSFALGRLPTPLAANLTVPYARHSLDASFSALTFVNEESVAFRHRLLGLDDTWTETTQREVHYSALPPGRYQLQVQTAVVPGQWSGIGVDVPFRVQAPWWREWWARVGFLVLIVGITRHIWRWRVRAMLRRQQDLERAVADRTQKLALEHDLALQEKARAEREKEKVEAQKVEIERLLWESRQAERVKGEFVTNMSHEVRTPLNTIIGMTDVVLQSPLNEDQSECLRMVQSSSASLLALMNGVLDFSSVQGGGFRLECSVLDFTALIRSAVEPLAEPARQKGLQLRMRLAPNFPPSLVGDAARLQQVVANLVDNAIKFTAKGFVEVIAEAHSIADGHAVIHVAVRDTGIGIAPEQQALIFEPFRQVDGSSSRRYSGTGLGLAMCSRLAGLMQGRIWVESTPGVGSSFHFTATLGIATEQPDQTRDRRNGAAGSATGLHVLLVEDNLVNQKLARRLLEKGGHVVTCASDGAEALQACEKGRFDAILMDIQMPVMDGFEATAEIRKREKALGHRTPVLALTANAMQGDRERCLAAGMDGYVTKPINTPDLLQSIADAVGAAAHAP